MKSPGSSSAGKSSNEQHEFNWLLFTRLGMLFRIFFPRFLCSTTAAAFVFFVAAILFEITVFMSGLVPARFIKVNVQLFALSVRYDFWFNLHIRNGVSM
ncbi:Uncharacterised protein r2_g3088 [Pycnogonum litorale]